MPRPRRQLTAKALLPLLVLLQACPSGSDDQHGSSAVERTRQELDFGRDISLDTTGLAERTSHRADAPVGPDSARLQFEWRTGSRNGRRTPYGISVIIPKHPRIDRFVPRVTSLTLGEESDSIYVATVAVEHTRTKGTDGHTRVVLVTLGGDGELRVVSP